MSLQQITALYGLMIHLNKIISMPNTALMFVPLTFIIPLACTLSDACNGVGVCVLIVHHVEKLLRSSVCWA